MDLIQNYCEMTKVRIVTTLNSQFHLLIQITAFLKVKNIRTTPNERIRDTRRKLRDKVTFEAGCERPELIWTALARECNPLLENK